MSESHAMATYRAALSGCQQELLIVLQRHAAALGPVGQFDAVIEFAGSVGDALLEAGPIAQNQAHIAHRVTELALYLATTRSKPQ